MRKLIRPLALLAPIFGVMMYIGFFGSPVNAADSTNTEIEDPYDNEVFPRDLKYLFPPPVPVFSNPDRKFMTKICEDEDYQKKHGLSEEDLTTRKSCVWRWTSEELSSRYTTHHVHAGKLR